MKKVTKGWIEMMEKDDMKNITTQEHVFVGGVTTISIRMLIDSCVFSFQIEVPVFFFFFRFLRHCCPSTVVRASCYSRMCLRSRPRVLFVGQSLGICRWQVTEVIN
jgi:hypothetical protein